MVSLIDELLLLPHVEVSYRLASAYELFCPHSSELFANSFMLSEDLGVVLLFGLPYLSFLGNLSFALLFAFFTIS